VLDLRVWGGREGEGGASLGSLYEQGTMDSHPAGRLSSLSAARSKADSQTPAWKVTASRYALRRDHTPGSRRTGRRLACRLRLPGGTAP
jgi:hypothetical protein